jgi:N12 class adenine-specific DNA methylase/predicted  nucleic acid-binding Zn-ribbon protein
MPEIETDSIESFNNKYNKSFSPGDLKIWENTAYDGKIEVGKLSTNEKNNLKNNDNICIDSKGDYYHVTNYASGNIYQKLEDLEKARDEIGEERYNRQKKILEDVLPEWKSTKNFFVSPISDFAKNFKFEDEETGENIKFNDRFFEWATGGRSKYYMDWEGGVTQHDLPTGVSWSDIVDYILQKPVTAARGGDKSTNKFLAEKTKELRREIAEKLVKRFIETGLHADEQKQLEDKYNQTYNSYIAPDYSKIPLFLNGISTKFKGHDLMVKEKQLQGASFLCNKGNGLLAYDVGVGKGHLLTSDILTPGGFRKMGDINIGDKVIGKNGLSTEVIGVYPLGKVQCYRVTFSDGSFTDVSDQHLWSVQTINYRAKYKDKWQTVMTEDIKDSLYNYRGDYQYSIPMVEPIEFNPRKIDIHPYFLGALIGDGCMSQKSISFSNSEKDIISKIEKILPYNVEMTKKQGDNVDYNLKGVELLKILKKYKLHGKKSNNKFIPDDFKFNTSDVRLEVLRGLLDTDGWIKTEEKKKGCTVIYTTVSKQLADDVSFIVNSLGGTVKMNDKIPFYTYNGEKKQGQKAYNITIRMPENIIPVSSKKQKRKFVSKTKYQPIRFIKSIESIGKQEAQCIKVSAKDELYVCEKSCIVTHNTLTGILATMNQLQTGRAKKPVVCVPKAVYTNWIKEIKDLFPDVEINDLGNLGAKKVKGKMPEIKDGTLSIITYEALSNITFKDETIHGGLLDDMVDSQEVSKEGASDREKAAAREKIQTLLGKAVKAKSEVLKSGIKFNEIDILNTVKTPGGNSDFVLTDYNGRKIHPNKIKSAFDLSGRKAILVKTGPLWEILDVETMEQIAPGTQSRSGVLNGLLEKLENWDEEEFKKSFEGYEKVNKDFEDNFETMPDDAKKLGSFYFEDLGFDHITVDEVHNFKNIFAAAKPQNSFSKEGEQSRMANEFQGISGSQSDRGLKMFAISQIIQKNNNDRNVFALSATPFTNSPLEIYNILSLVARKKLKELGIYNLHEFMAQFAKMKNEWAVDSKGNITRKTVMKEFQNLSALQNLIREYIDKVDGKEAGIERPVKNTHIAEMEMTPVQKAIYKVEMERFDLKDANGRPAPGATLVAINNMRMATVSPSLINFDDELYSKTDIADMVKQDDFVEDSPKLKFTTDSIANLYNENPDLGQIMYMPRGIDEYDKVINNLVKKGIPKSAIATIHSKTSDDKKDKIMSEFNNPNGKIKVVIGSETIKEGVNLNGNTATIYNTLLGWNPTETIQVEGRAWRQGNKQGNVHVVYPQLIDSVDSSMYQKHDEKGKRLDEVWSYKGDLLNVEDINAEELKFDLIKDPEKRAKFDMDIKIEKIEDQMREKRIFIDTLNKYKSDYDNSGSELSRLDEKIKDYKEDVVTAENDLQNEMQSLKDFKKQTSKDDYRYDSGIRAFEADIKYAKEKLSSEKKYVRDAEREKKIAKQTIEGISEKLNDMGIDFSKISDRIAQEEKIVSDMHEEIVSIKNNKDEYVRIAKEQIAARQQNSTPKLHDVITNNVNVIRDNLRSFSSVKEAGELDKNRFFRNSTLQKEEKLEKAYFVKHFNSETHKFEYRRVR